MSRSLKVGFSLVAFLLVVSLIGMVIYYNSYVADHHYTDQEYANENAVGYGLGFLDGNRTGFKSGNQSGYDFGYRAGVASRGFTIIDPSYQQMSAFMAKDTVHDHQYTDTYVCWNFCDDYINEAFTAGWRCGFVYIDQKYYAHGVVCFNTTDKGIVFVEPQFNVIVKLIVGSSYSSSNGFEWEFFDVIQDFEIVW